jgi:hypothetical protein
MITLSPAALAAPQATLAALYASSQHRKSPLPARRRAVLFALLRGLTNLELTHLEFQRHCAPAPHRTAAVLRYKMCELVFEAPQVIVAWTVLMGRITVDELSWAAIHRPQPIKECE